MLFVDCWDISAPSIPGTFQGPKWNSCEFGIWIDIYRSTIFFMGGLILQYPAVFDRWVIHELPLIRFTTFPFLIVIIRCSSWESNRMFWFFTHWAEEKGIWGSCLGVSYNIATEDPFFESGSGMWIPIALKRCLISNLLGVCGRLAAPARTVIKFRSSHASVLMSSPQKKIRKN